MYGVMVEMLLVDVWRYGGYVTGRCKALYGDVTGRCVALWWRCYW